MQLSDFDFNLPPELIARKPAENRAGSRMMVLDRSTSSVIHDHFQSLVQYLNPGDVLVLNDTRVIPARLLGRKETGGKVEIFLTERLADDCSEWECLTKSSKPLKAGTKVLFPEEVSGEMIVCGSMTGNRIRFDRIPDLAEKLDRIGHMPLPPYIGREDDQDDRERYQTVYARKDGALAAPTAGLHFTDEVLAQLASAGIRVEKITLHVGLGTFLPVRVENVADHRMHEERYSVTPETAAAVNEARKSGRRVVAVGTTVARTLESVWDQQADEIVSGAGSTGIFIYPGYQFRAVDALMTNFHLPQSTLLMLVSAFADRDFVLDAYHQAIGEEYRFYSYGDCMLIQ